MSSASSAVAYTSVYTDSEPGRVFWGADEELLDGDEDERKPMFIQAHGPDYVPEPMYPEYIPLEDEHVLLAEEQPLPPLVSPTVGLPGEDGGDDDDGDSSGDDVDDEDDKDAEDEEEEHLALADSPPKGTEPVIPPPSIDTTTTIARITRITVRLQASTSLPSKAEVERLLAISTLPPSPLTSLSPTSAEERIVRCTASSAHSSPPPVPSPLLTSSGCPTQIQTLRMASTQALIDTVTAALPSPPL
nr:hypothetical protein [Tanacetum cinerariifolium]